MVRSRLIPSSLFITACLSLTGCAQTSTAVQTEQLLKTAHAWEGTRYEAYPEGRPENEYCMVFPPKGWIKKRGLISCR